MGTGEILFLVLVLALPRVRGDPRLLFARLTPARDRSQGELIERLEHG
jgi:hypothetical protein